ncbi:N-acetyltransferase family protein [Blastococcus sp. SYSU D00695]
MASYGATVLVRDAVPSDAASCAAVYAPYVSDAAVSFEAVAPTAAEMAGRIARAQERHAWLVAEVDGRVVGYAAAGEWMAREAYRWTCAVSVYLEPGRRRTGAGRALYGRLFPRLVERGYRTALAGIALPNPASEGLHRALGFTPVGTFERVGFKRGRWHDVTWFQRPLTDDDGPPAPLR